MSLDTNENEKVKIIFNDMEYELDDTTINNIKEKAKDTILTVLLECEKENNTIKINRSGKNFKYLLDVYNGKAKTCYTYLKYLKYLKNKKSVAYYYFNNNVKKYYEDLLYFGFLKMRDNIDNTKNLNIMDNKCIQKFRKRLFNKVLNDMTEYRYTKNKLNDFLISSGSIVSGSFVLENYLNEDWGNKDIDIYVNNERFKRICDENWEKYIESIEKSKSMDVKYRTNLLNFYMENENECKIKYTLAKIFECSPKNIKDFKQISKEDENTIITAYSVSKSFFKLIKFKINKMAIDLILSTCEPIEFINKFDFDFNKIYYNGYAISAYDWNSINKRISYNNTEYNIKNITSFYLANVDRIEKYYLRGFTILLEQNNHDEEYQYIDIDNDDYNNYLKNNSTI